MTDDPVNDALGKAVKAAPTVEPAMLARITGSINQSLRPVRPLPSDRVLIGAVTLVCAAVAMAAAAGAGFYGVARLTVIGRLAIFSTLGILTGIAAREFVARFIPGSRRVVAVSTLLALAAAALLAVFALIFRNYRTEHFFSAGIACLLVGTLVALPAALLSALVLRRGFAVDPAASGLVGGILGGLGGVTMLELHCPNFQALHVLVWHTAVLPVCAAIGLCVGRASQLPLGYNRLASTRLRQHEDEDA